MSFLNLLCCFCCKKNFFKRSAIYESFFSSAKACNCSSAGSASLQCDVLTGQCQCKTEFGGRDCSRCALGYRDYPDCVACDCDLSGTKVEMCNGTEGVCGCEEETGVCTCKVLSHSAPSGKTLVLSRHWVHWNQGKYRAERTSKGNLHNLWVHLDHCWRISCDRSYY